MPIFGPDVSEWQGRVDWQKVAASGHIFGIARATYGSNHPDVQYQNNRKGMRGAGLIPGSYHYLTPTDGVAQAISYIRQADPTDFHCLDIESASLTRQHLDSWFTTYRKTYPHKMVRIYTNKGLWDRVYGALTGSQYGPLWFAGYRDGLYTPAQGSIAQQYSAGGVKWGGPFNGWTTVDIQQITDHAKVPGVSGPCDGNVCYLSPAELKLSCRVAPPDPPKPQPTVHGGTDMLYRDEDGAIYLPLVKTVNGVVVTALSHVTLPEYSLHEPSGAPGPAIFQSTKAYLTAHGFVIEP